MISLINFFVLCDWKHPCRDSAQIIPALRNYDSDAPFLEHALSFSWAMLCRVKTRPTITHNMLFIMVFVLCDWKHLCRDFAQIIPALCNHDSDKPFLEHALSFLCVELYLVKTRPTFLNKINELFGFFVLYDRQHLCRDFDVIIPALCNHDSDEPFLEHALSF